MNFFFHPNLSLVIKALDIFRHSLRIWGTENSHAVIENTGNSRKTNVRAHFSLLHQLSLASAYLQEDGPTE
jgi:hypothetical protein